MVPRTLTMRDDRVMERATDWKGRGLRMTITGGDRDAASAEGILGGNHRPHERRQ